MNGVELTKAVARDTGVPEEEVKDIIQSFKDIIIRTVSDGDYVVIRNFGTFAPHVRKAKIAQDLQRNRPVVVPEKTIPKFRPATVFTEAIQKRLNEKKDIQ